MAAKQLTVTQYAEKHHITRQSTLERIKAGKVQAEKIGSVWIITEPDHD